MRAAMNERNKKTKADISETKILTGAFYQVSIVYLFNFKKINL